MPYVVWTAWNLEIETMPLGSGNNSLKANKSSVDLESR